MEQLAKKSFMRVVLTVEKARKLEINFRNNQTMLTPNFIMTTKGGALNGIIKHNLKEVNYQGVSLNFHDMYDYFPTLAKYREHLEKLNADLLQNNQQNNQSDEQKLEQQHAKNPLKRYFNFDDKLVMFSPFSYSVDKEKVSGFNDETHFQVNFRHKVHVDKYFEFALQNTPDMIVSPCEQVTFTSGKKKRKRSQKAALKNFEQFQKLIKQHQDEKQNENSSDMALLMPVLLGDDDGLDSFEMKMLEKQFSSDNEDNHLNYQGFMIYGTDQLVAPSAYQEVKNLMEKLPQDKIRATHGQGSTVEVLNGILSGLDIFESDYPLSLAEQGIAILIKDFQLIPQNEENPKTPAKSYLELSKQLQSKNQRTLKLSLEENKDNHAKLVEGCDQRNERQYSHWNSQCMAV
eukprot:403364131